MKRVIAGLTCVLAISACGQQGGGAKGGSAEAANGTVTLQSGISIANFDDSVRPQDSLYLSVNGNWISRTAIPEDKSNLGAFTSLGDNASEELRGIIEDLASSKDKKPGSVEQKVGDFYAAFMDEQTVDALGIEPLKPLFAEIDAVRTSADLQIEMGHLMQDGIGVPVVPYVHPDSKNGNVNILDLWQLGISLPDRDFYLETDPKLAVIRQRYEQYMAQMMSMAGFSTPDAVAANVLDLETRIATAHWDKVKVRDPVKGYNPYAVEDLPKLAPQIAWPEYLKAMGAPEVKTILVSQPSFVTDYGKLLASVPLQTWKDYLKWLTLNSYAPYLSKPFVDENFAFFEKTLNGIPQNTPRWKRGVNLIEQNMGEAVGQVYVKRYFPPESKTEMESLVQNLAAVYKTSIENVDWMSATTRKAALDKLAKMKVMVGYPDHWRDYSRFQVQPGKLVEDIRAANAFDNQRHMDEIGKPADRSEWIMTPQTVNAYSNPELNEVVFPAAILQPPFFQADADPAVNYGGIGAIIGHEMSHAFDNTGSEYDGDGHLKSWWTDEDKKKYDQKINALMAQYDKFEPIHGYFVNGKYTLGEDIADLAGLTIAYRAYHLSLAGKEAPVIDGLTGDQRFFMGWAQVWRRKYRDENLLTRLKTDTHAPSEYRCDGVVTNMDSFYKAFDVQPGDKLYTLPDQRISLW